MRRILTYRRQSRSERGMTLLELILACAILMILSSAALPIARYSIVHKKEELLRYDLRQIPVDPMTGQADWGLRAVQDDPDSTSWGGKNVFDVYSKSQGTASDGTRYSDSRFW